MNCNQRHPVNLPDGKTLEEVAKELGDLRYDRLIEFLDYLANDLERQSHGDAKRNRIKLSASLYRTSESLRDSRDCLMRAWEICKPYMEK